MGIQNSLIRGGISMTKIAPPPFPEDMSLEEAIMCINRTSYRPIPDNSGLDEAYLHRLEMMIESQDHTS